MATPPVSQSRVQGSGGVSLAVQVTGDGLSPTLVLVHGYPDTSAVWSAVRDRLAGRYRVVTYDVRGAGASERPEGRRPYRLEHLEADLAAVVDAACSDARVHLVGHDWGSMQAWEAVTGDRLAGRFASFTSISGPCLDHVGMWLRAQRHRPGGWRKVVRQLSRSWYVYAFQMPVLPELAWRTVVPRGLPRYLSRTEGLDLPSAATLADDGATGVRLYRANVLPRVLRPRSRRTSVPVQMIVPTGDAYVTPALVEAAEPWVDDLCARFVAGTHWIVRRDADAVAAWIAQFVDHVESGGRARDLRPALNEPG